LNSGNNRKELAFRNVKLAALCEMRMQTILRAVRFAIEISRLDCNEIYLAPLPNSKSGQQRGMKKWSATVGGYPANAMPAEKHNRAIEAPSWHLLIFMETMSHKGADMFVMHC